MHTRTPSHPLNVQLVPHLVSDVERVVSPSSSPPPPPAPAGHSLSLPQTVSGLKEERNQHIRFLCRLLHIQNVILCVTVAVILTNVTHW